MAYILIDIGIVLIIQYFTITGVINKLYYVKGR